MKTTTTFKTNFNPALLLEELDLKGVKVDIINFDALLFRAHCSEEELKECFKEAYETSHYREPVVARKRKKELLPVELISMTWWEQISRYAKERKMEKKTKRKERGVQCFAPFVKYCETYECLAYGTCPWTE